MTTCNVCGSDRVTMRAGILVDLAIYPTKRYLRGPHSQTCTGPIVIPVRSRKGDQIMYEGILALVAQGIPIPPEKVEQFRLATL